MSKLLTICRSTKFNLFNTSMYERVRAVECPGFLIFLARTFFLIHVLVNEITFIDMKNNLSKRIFHGVYRTWCFGTLSFCIWRFLNWFEEKRRQFNTGYQFFWFLQNVARHTFRCQFCALWNWRESIGIRERTFSSFVAPNYSQTKLIVLLIHINYYVFHRLNRQKGNNM